MKKILIPVILVLLSGHTLFSQSKKENSPLSRPKIVIGIVMDQMRWDYLYRYYDKYSEGGFRRLLNEGFSCENTYINYLPSYTAPGHATIYTGTTPAYHGIVANDWIENSTGFPMYCVQDDNVNSLGTGDQPQSGMAGMKSPKNLLTTTISDELKLHYNFRNKSFGISLKDRGAILPAGHTADGAFWFDGLTGNFITSSFYYNIFPEWIESFNERRIADSLLSIVWNTLYPIHEYTQSTPDNSKYEGIHKFETTPTFPHDFRPSLEKDFSRMPYSPFGNTIVRLLAEELIIKEELGKKGLTDFLAISFSATDYIGHLYGPNAVEIEDMYYRLDQDVSQFMSFLDKQFGKDNYIVFLTADHGGAHNASFLKDNKIPAGYFENKNNEVKLRNALKAEDINDSALLQLTNYQVYLNEKFIEDNDIDYDDVYDIIKMELLKDPSVAHIIDITDLNDKTIPLHIQSLLSESFYSPRSGQMQIILKPGFYSGGGYSTGTTHGGWHPYDTHIPLIFYGWNIPKGRKVYRKVNMTDIAPTLAALLKIQEPNANIGEVVHEIFDK